MTIHLRLPLAPEPGVHAGPSRFARPAPEPLESFAQLVTSIHAAKRIVVVCGAGVSTAASIPDFRGAGGLFASPDKGKGKDAVRDLFHVKCLSSPALLEAHHALITELASLAIAANPTSFHAFLSSLNSDGKLLRVFTQNIDNLEEKAGLSAGLPPKPISKSPRKSNSPAKTPIPTPPDATTSRDPVDNGIVQLTPRVIPLHGTLSSLHCPLCHTTAPLTSHLPLPPSIIPCPTCALSSSIRSALSERQRRTGYLRPSVVLYGEEHPQGDLIGAQVERDLKGTGGKLREGKVDFVLVAGTSLLIPGVKRIVKEMCKAVKGKKGIRTVFINNEPPKNGAEWQGVFDIWVEGDVQTFVELVNSKEWKERKVPTTPKKLKPAKTNVMLPPTPESIKTEKAHSTVKDIVDDITPTKPKLQVESWPPTPRATPPSPSKSTSIKRKYVTDDSPSKKTKLHREVRWATPESEVE